MTFFKVLKEVKSSRNICNEYYSRVISQRVSHYFSAFFIVAGFSPNSITALMGVFIIPISVGLYCSSDSLSIVFAFSLILINIFDTSDGEVARFTNKTSIKGVFYDKFFQLFADVFLISFLALKFIKTSDFFIFHLIFLYLSIYVINTYLKRLSEIYVKKNSKKIKKSSIMIFLSNVSSNTFFFHTLWILFVFKAYGDVSLFENISILYFLNLIILNLFKSLFLFKNIVSNIK